MESGKNEDKHGSAAPSLWVIEHGSRIRTGGTVLDLAAGRGRHSRWFLERGYSVVAVDRDITGLSEITGNPNAEVLEADLENAPWPLAGRPFDGIVVTNYLWRPLFPKIQDSLSPDGVLIYETFGIGNEKYGKPSNPDFLLHEGELRDAFSNLEAVAYAHGRVESPKPAIVQKFCAIKRG